jgi:hypothetical protein
MTDSYWTLFILDGQNKLGITINRCDCICAEPLHSGFVVTEMRIHTLLLQSTLWYCWNLETMLSGIISSCKSGGRIVKVLRVWILKDDGGACRSLVALLRPAPKKTRWQKRLLRGGWNDQQMMSSVGLWQIFSCPKRWRCLLHVKCWEITSWTELVPHSNVVNWASSICHMLLLQYLFPWFERAMLLHYTLVPKWTIERKQPGISQITEANVLVSRATVYRSALTEAYILEYFS